MALGNGVTDAFSSVTSSAADDHEWDQSKAETSTCIVHGLAANTGANFSSSSLRLSPSLPLVPAPRAEEKAENERTWLINLSLI